MESKRIGNKYFIKKICGVCGKESWKRKDTEYRYCSLRCFGKSIQKSNGKCLFCEKQLPSRMPNGIQFVKRKFCSKGCFSEYYSNERSYRWTGGVLSSGYKKIRLKRNSYQREHRLIMEKHLGRKLRKGEVVHHINHDRKDNRIENLEVMSSSEHTRHHLKERWEKESKKIDLSYVRGEIKNGATVSSIAKHFGVNECTIYRRLKLNK